MHFMYYRYGNFYCVLGATKFEFEKRELELNKKNSKKIFCVLAIFGSSFKLFITIIFENSCSEKSQGGGN